MDRTCWFLTLALLLRCRRGGPPVLKMCGILGILLGDTSDHVAPLLVDGLTVLQHRGQGTRESVRPYFYEHLDHIYGEIT